MSEPKNNKIAPFCAPSANWQAHMAVFQPGFVWLAGAGPGHVRHLTLEVFQALQSADIVFYDALVSQEVLDLAGASVQLEFVGKRAGRPSPSQDEITEKMIASARDQKRVLRLKGGDPFVFGRGAEEALNLQKAGVNFRILPGITAGIGGFGQAKMPLSHRDFNQSISFITAHDASGGLSQKIPWRALGDSSQLLVIYMGLRLLGEIKIELTKGGMDPETPAALMSNASLPHERILFTSVGDMARDAKAEQLKGPVVTMIGQTVLVAKQLRDEGAAISGFEHVPLVHQN